MSVLPDRYLTKKQAVEKYHFLTANMLKNLLFKDIDDFREKVVRKVGRRILLDEEALLRFLADGRESQMKEKDFLPTRSLKNARRQKDAALI